MTTANDFSNSIASSPRKRKVESESEIENVESSNTVNEGVLNKKVKVGSDSTPFSTVTEKLSLADTTLQSTIHTTTNKDASMSTPVKEIRNLISPQASIVRDIDSDSDVSIVSKPIINFDMKQKLLSHVSSPHTVSVGSPSHMSMGYVSADEKTNECTDSDNGSVDNENTTQSFIDEEKVSIYDGNNSTFAKIESETPKRFMSVIRGLVVTLFYAVAFGGIYMKLNPSVEFRHLIKVLDIDVSYFSNLNMTEVSDTYSVVVVAVLGLLAFFLGVKTFKNRSERSVFISSWYYNLFCITLIGSFYVAVIAVVYDKLNPSQAIPNSVYVAGGGFSGFWYTLGRLQGLDDFKSKEVYCYSAGCLAAVSIIADLPMRNVLDSALDAQARWNNGELHRYDVVPTFIDDLLACKQESTSGLVECIEDDEGNLIHPLDDMEALSRLNVLTTKVDFANDSILSWVTSVSRKVKNIKELKHILQQSTWIPYVVGNGTSLEGHMDGAYTAFAHPKCEYYAGLTSDADLLLNVVNIHLDGNQAENLYQKGKNFVWGEN